MNKTFTIILIGCILVSVLLHYDQTFFATLVAFIGGMLVGEENCG